MHTSHPSSLSNSPHKELVDVNVLGSFDRSYRAQLEAVADAVADDLLAACLADVASAGAALFDRK